MIGRIKDRKKRKSQLSDRKSLAAQQRMKTIATLADDSTSKGKRRKKGNGQSARQSRADAVLTRWPHVQTTLSAPTMRTGPCTGTSCVNFLRPRKRRVADLAIGVRRPERTSQPTRKTSKRS